MEEEVKTLNKHKGMQLNTWIHRNLKLKMYVRILHQLRVQLGR